MLRRLSAATLLVAGLASTASAQADLTNPGFVAAGGVHYTTFTVTGAGTFDIWTTSITYPIGATPFDPEMWLFSGVGTGGAALDSNDDGCFSFLAQCGPTIGVFQNSILNNIVLGVGSYTMAVGSFDLTEAEARSGVNNQLGGGDYALRIASLTAFGGGDGEAFINEQVSTIPEPASMTLLATGLAGMAAARRRRRKV